MTLRHIRLSSAGTSVICSTSPGIDMSSRISGTGHSPQQQEWHWPRKLDNKDYRVYALAWRRRDPGGPGLGGCHVRQDSRKLDNLVRDRGQ